MFLFIFSTYVKIVAVENTYIKISIMAIRVVEFSNEEYKIRKIFAYESTYPKEIIEF